MILVSITILTRVMIVKNKDIAASSAPSETKSRTQNKNRILKSKYPYS